ncbi:dna-binding protein [Leptolyngbya sp. Heron Island J]|uniref:cold-shock protein n=1 Tax=Leptolyngbya sp. Heron Island J TaxID=1385935 RepID=UPI0003B93C8C|nr:dna-binding protein [Leptolyngbya sp. Heron Island J]
MKPNLHKRQLKAWKDDRGFGFIKPNDGGRDVLLHSSALKGTGGRRPKVGDTIYMSELLHLTASYVLSDLNSRS